MVNRKGAENAPPACRPNREPSVGAHRNERKRGEVPAELPALQTVEGGEKVRSVRRKEGERKEKRGSEEGGRRTRIPQTIEISSAVGTTWKTTEERRKEIPLREETRSAAAS